VGNEDEVLNLMARNG